MTDYTRPLQNIRKSVYNASTVIAIKTRAVVFQASGYSDRNNCIRSQNKSGIITDSASGYCSAVYLSVAVLHLFGMSLGLFSLLSGSFRISLKLFGSFLGGCSFSLGSGSLFLYLLQLFLMSLQKSGSGFSIGIDGFRLLNFLMSFLWFLNLF